MHVFFLYSKFNIYKDSAPSEAIGAVPLLNSLVERVSKLLDEWPDHPVLQQVHMWTNLKMYASMV